MRLNVALLGILGHVYANVLVRDCNTHDLKKPTNFDEWECIPSSASASGYELIFYWRMEINSISAMFLMVQRVHLYVKIITFHFISD